MIRRIGLIAIMLGISIGSGHIVQTRAAQEKAVHSTASVIGENG